jgi:hypothetical protein
MRKARISTDRIRKECGEKIADSFERLRGVTLANYVKTIINDDVAILTMAYAEHGLYEIDLRNKLGKLGLASTETQWRHAKVLEEAGVINRIRVHTGFAGKPKNQLLLNKDGFRAVFRGAPK